MNRFPKRLSLVAIVAFLVSSCASMKAKKYNGTFCYVYKVNIICSEKSGEQYVTVDYPLSHISEMEGHVLIPVEEFESKF